MTKFKWNENYSTQSSKLLIPLIEKNENNTSLIKINSNREPFAYQYLINKYGGLGTKLGTNL